MLTLVAQNGESIVIDPKQQHPHSLLHNNKIDKNHAGSSQGCD